MIALTNTTDMAAVVEKITRRLGIQMNLSVPDLVHGVLQRKDAWVSALDTYRNRHLEALNPDELEHAR